MKRERFCSMKRKRFGSCGRRHRKRFRYQKGFLLGRQGVQRRFVAATSAKSVMLLRCSILTRSVIYLQPNCTWTAEWNVKAAEQENAQEHRTSCLKGSDYRVEEQP
jgi:hypothetical protein